MSMHIYIIRYGRNKKEGEQTHVRPQQNQFILYLLLC